MTYILFGFDTDIINSIINDKPKKLIIFDENEDNNARQMFESCYANYKNITMYEGDILLVFNTFLKLHPEEQDIIYKISNKIKNFFNLKSF